jgi:hypothetical protein
VVGQRSVPGNCSVSAGGQINQCLVRSLGPGAYGMLVSRAKIYQGAAGLTLSWRSKANGLLRYFGGSSKGYLRLRNYLTKQVV